MTIRQIRVAVNGYGVIGKRVADAVAVQEDMELVGVVAKGYPVYAATPEAAAVMQAAGIQVTGAPETLLGRVDVVADATPKRIASANLAKYRDAGVKSIFQGGENMNS